MDEQPFPPMYVARFLMCSSIIHPGIIISASYSSIVQYSYTFSLLLYMQTADRYMNRPDFRIDMCKIIICRLQINSPTGQFKLYK